MARSYERRSDRNRRDWNVFVYPDRRSKRDRRSGTDRRQLLGPQEGPERRRLVPLATESPPPQPIPAVVSEDQAYFTTAEVAQKTGLSQTTLLLWIRNKVIDGSRIKRSVEGRRLWTREDIAEIERVKTRNGWAS